MGQYAILALRLRHQLLCTTHLVPTAQKSPGNPACLAQQHQEGAHIGNFALLQARERNCAHAGCAGHLAQAESALMRPRDTS